MVSDTAVFVLIVALFVVSAVLAFGLEPHWSNRDGSRFIARAAILDPRERPQWVEVRGWVHDDHVELRARRGKNGDVNGDFAVRQIVEGNRRTKVVQLSGDRDVMLRLPRNSRSARAIGALLS